jgi:hypothetical protein
MQVPRGALPTPQVINVWNHTNCAAVGLFHVTC